MDQPAQESAGGQHHGAAGKPAAIRQQHRRQAPIGDFEIQDLALDHVETRLFANRRLHGEPIEFSVGLRARPANGRALAAVEQAELDAGRIGDAPHQPVHGVDLANQMALAEPADRRIARHDADRLEAQRHQSGLRTSARGSTGRLATSMAAAHHHHIIVIGHFSVPGSG